MMALSKAERETHINMVADDRTQWEVFSDDEVMLRRLEAIGAECIGEVGEGRRYRLAASQVRFHKLPVQMTAAQRAERAARFKGKRSQSVQLVGTN